MLFLSLITTKNSKVNTKRSYLRTLKRKQHQAVGVESQILKNFKYHNEFTGLLSFKNPSFEMKEPEFQKCLQVQAVKTLRETIYFCLESREKGFCETTSVGQGRIPCFPQISLPALPRNPQCQNLTATVSGMLSMQPCWHLNSIWQKKLGKRGSCGLKNMGGFVFAYYFFSYLGHF